MYFHWNTAECLTFVFAFCQQNGNFPETIGDMVGLRWLKLDQTGLTEAPEELGKLQKLVSSIS